ARVIRAAIHWGRVRQPGEGSKADPFRPSEESQQLSQLAAYATGVAVFLASLAVLGTLEWLIDGFGYTSSPVLLMGLVSAAAGAGAGWVFGWLAGRSSSRRPGYSLGA